LVDSAPDINGNGGDSYSVISQTTKSAFYFCNKPEHEKTKTERYMNGHYTRFMHNIRDFMNPYCLGRHNFKHPAKPVNLHILKCLFSPYPEFFARKLQIGGRIPESNRQAGWGFQHLVQISDLCEQYEDRRRMPLLELDDIEGNLKYYDVYMRDNTKEGENDTNNMLLTGIFMNLYESVVQPPKYN
jgi:hypothetical protein